MITLPLVWPWSLRNASLTVLNPLEQASSDASPAETSAFLLWWCHATADTTRRPGVATQAQDIKIKTVVRASERLRSDALSPDGSVQPSTKECSC